MADNGILFDYIHIDFSKVFDKFSIPLLINKCPRYGIGPRTEARITDHLTNKTQDIAVGEALSSLCHKWSSARQLSWVKTLLPFYQ